PYFVAGAIYSGFAMVLLLAIPLRTFYGLKAFITDNHLEVMGKILIATGMLTCYGYFSEQFMAWYGQVPSEHQLYTNRGIGFGQMSFAYWGTIFCNAIPIQFLWLKRVRRNPIALFIISLFITLGMWLERYFIITTSLHRDFLPSSWGMFQPTIWDYLTYFGTIGFFLVAFLLFIRLLPVISMSEMRALLPAGQPAREEGR
ncbi:MAG TPA: NrfD/PsrC family molybdoenzyme membrane anchor subunit, partial [Gemmataceae bacterium]|nr:NrfD/PsrC family molybdoenzyme membrane anchor subunit [Gemmataceae bacterium]